MSTPVTLDGGQKKPKTLPGRKAEVVHDGVPTRNDGLHSNCTKNSLIRKVGKLTDGKLK
jgi:hypothetical protein